MPDPFVDTSLYDEGPFAELARRMPSDAENFPYPFRPVDAGVMRSIGEAISALAGEALSSQGTVASVGRALMHPEGWAPRAANWATYNLTPAGAMLTASRNLTARGMPESAEQGAETVMDLANLIPGEAQVAAASKLAGTKLVPALMGILAGEKAGGFRAAKEAGRVFEGMYDRMPRFEIPDTNMSLDLSRFKQTMKPEGKEFLFTGKAGDVVGHPELYENYPWAKDLDLQVLVSPIASPRAYHSGGTINVVARSPQEARGFLPHELQHAIQEAEGHAVGSSIDAQVAAAVDSPIRAYLNHAGEIEARIAAERLGLTPEQLMNIPFYSSKQAIPIEEAIIKYRK